MDLRDILEDVRLRVHQLASEDEMQALGHRELRI
jgi:hypothetical protein